MTEDLTGRKERYRKRPDSEKEQATGGTGSGREGMRGRPALEQNQSCGLCWSEAEARESTEQESGFMTRWLVKEIDGGAGGG